jgi:hypothetical protein
LHDRKAGQPQTRIQQAPYSLIRQGLCQASGVLDDRNGAKARRPPGKRQTKVGFGDD